MEFLGLEIKDIILIIILILSIIIHEMAHGYAALFQGDVTAKQAGRLTLNPIPHIDPIGSLLLPGILLAVSAPFLLGYAKPVPYNPANLRNKKWGEAIVSVAGPLSNFILAFVFLLIFAILKFSGGGNDLIFNILVLSAFMNIILAILNLIPVPPLDGSKILLDFFKNFNLKIYYWLRNIFAKYFWLLFIIILLIILNANFLIILANQVLAFYGFILFL